MKNKESDIRGFEPPSEHFKEKRTIRPDGSLEQIFIKIRRPIRNMKGYLAGHQMVNIPIVFEGNYKDTGKGG